MNSNKSKIPVFAVNTRNQNSSKWTQNIGPQQWTPNKGNAHSTSNIITSTPNVRNFELPLKSRYQPCGEGSSAPARIPRHRNPTLPNFTPPSASGSPGAGFLAGEKLSPIEAGVLDVDSPSPSLNERDPWTNEGDESLGLLTPEQMAETSLHFGETIWPDMDLSETRDSLLENQSFPDFLYAPIPSEDTVALGHNSDSRSKLSSPESTRADLTLSPEDPPIDLIPSIESVESEHATAIAVPDVNAASTSFITSVTSIASLDNGYQGDGELSRPGSRGPSVHVQVPPPPPTLPSLPIVASHCDPMTDSDFFTESDLDGHDDSAMAAAAAAAAVAAAAASAHGTRAGDRRAQVIDGIVYGSVNAPSNNHTCPSFLGSSATEEMDSSGIYSDLEKKPNDEINVPSSSPFPPSSSPDNSSRSASQRSQLIPENSQSISICDKRVDQSITIHRISSLEEPSSNPLTEHTKEVIPNANSNTNGQTKKDEYLRNKKFPMPKRKVESKIKLLIEKGRENDNVENRRPIRTTGRWDAVMSKIALGQAENKYKPNRLKQVKSKVLASIKTTESNTSSHNRINTNRTINQANQRMGNDSSSLKNKRSRGRIRTASCSHDSITISGQSSTSDLSATPSPAPSSTASRLGPQQTQSLSQCRSKSSKPGKSLKATSSVKTVSNKLQNNVSVPVLSSIDRTNGRGTLRSSTTKRYPPTPLPSREAKRQAGSQGAAPPRTTGAAAAAAATKTSAGFVRETAARRDLNIAKAQWESKYLPSLEHACVGFDAMTVLVQYLVNEYNAFETPRMKQQILRYKEEWVKAKLDYDELYATQLRERKRSDQRLYDHDQSHREEVRLLKCEYDYQLKKLEKELAKEQVSRIEAERNHREIETRLFEAKSTLKETESKLSDVTTRFTETEAKYITASAKLSDTEAKINEIQARLQVPSPPPPPPPPPAIIQSKWLELHNEISSLKTVLELKQKEIHGLRQANVRLTLEADRVPSLEQRVATLQARLEDLGLQLERKTSLERQLSLENRALGDSLQQTSQQRDRLTQDKEALQWRLKQNLDMYSILAEISGAEAVTAAAAQLHTNNERTDSYKGINPSPTQMKGMVHKGDSVSWVLDIDENAETVLNRLVRRASSFRSGSTSPPSNFTSPVHSKSLPTTKRQRQRVRSRHMRTKNNEEWTNQADEEKIEAGTSSVSVVGTLPNHNMESNLSATGSDGSSGSSPTPQETAQLLEARAAMRATLQEAGGEAMISEETSDEEHHNYSDEDQYNLNNDQNSMFEKDNINTSPSSMDKIDDF